MSNRQFIHFGAALALLVALAGCQKPADTVSIELRNAYVDASAGSMFVAVTAAQAWTISLEYPAGTESWASVTPTSGTGSKNDIRLKYSANESEENRTVTLVLNGQGAQARTTVTQNAKGSSGGGGQNTGGYGYDVAPASLDWLELPATKAKDGRELLIHDMDGNKYKSRGISGDRNWSCYWDYSHYISMWVAYPLNKSLIGPKITRTDAWGFDPIFGTNYDVQQDVSGGYLDGNNGWYSRGHQIPSADRLGTDARNATTFYGTNMTPQNNPFNGGIWAKLEEKVRSYSDSCDTLYVVTGCLVDGSTYYALDRSIARHRLTVPTYYYKALLAHTLGGTNGVEGYLAAGFLLPHDQSISGGKYIDYIRTIDKLEEETGVDFFPNLERKIGAEKAAQVEAAQPGNWWK